MKLHRSLPQRAALPVRDEQNSGIVTWFHRALPLVLIISAWNWIGPTSVIASELKSDEKVVFYPAMARRVRGGIELELHGLVYEPGQHALLARALRRAIGIDEEDVTPAEAALFRERIEYFLVDNERKKKFSVRIGGAVRELNSSTANGHFTTRLSLRDGEFPLLPTIGGDTNFVLSVEIPTSRGRFRSVPLEVHLLGETGLSIISDIDDTIKISDVRDRHALVHNTFCRPFTPVPGMAGVYRSWATNGAWFHYVTAGPWQLYLPLAEFTRGNGFPAGTFFMKTFRIKDSSFLALFSSPERYKPGVIEKLLKEFPRRQFVLVGDSGEKDPEIFGALARNHPRQIHSIFIRDVTGEPANAARYQRAFTNVPVGTWQIFREPAEMRALPAP